jgi:hypothetical protein
MEAWISENFRDAMRVMENEGLWQLEELYTAPYVREDESSCKLCLYRIPGSYINTSSIDFMET